MTNEPKYSPSVEELFEKDYEEKRDRPTGIAPQNVGKSKSDLYNTESLKEKHKTFNRNYIGKSSRIDDLKKEAEAKIEKWRKD
jgi:hypothetical protein